MLVIDVFEGSSFGYVLSNEFVEQFNMGLVRGTIGFSKKDRNTECPLNGSESHKFRSVVRRYGMQQPHPLEVSQTPINEPIQRLGILAIRQLFNDGIPHLSLSQGKDGFSLLNPDDKIHSCFKSRSIVYLCSWLKWLYFFITTQI
nr:hypothetical protein [Porphyromonas endodontalis]